MAKLKEKKKKIKTVEYGRYGYFFIAPFFITYLALQFWPLITTFYYSMFDYYKRNMKVHFEFYGLTNFFNILGITEGERAFALEYLGNTFVMWIWNFIPQILVSLLLAAWLTNTKIKLKGAGTYKIMTYMPNIITAASISALFYAMFTQYGPVTSTLREWGIISADFDFLKNVASTRGMIAFIQFWMWYGNTTLLLISGILGINPSLFEAADIDGATGGQKFFKITLPLMKPILLYVLVTSTIGGLQMYDIPALFNVSTNGTYIGLPDDKSTSIAMYIMRLYESSVGKAAAVSVLLFFVTLALSLIFFITVRDKKDPSMKKLKKSKGGVA